MREVNVGHKYLADYQSIVPKDLMAEIAELAEPLKGKRVVHVERDRVRRRGGRDPLHAGAADEGRRPGGRVARDDGRERVLQRHKAVHNGLQGARHRPRHEQGRAAPLQESTRNVSCSARHYDVVHGPRPAAAGHARLRLGAGATATARWIWRCHIDTLDARRGTLRLSAAVHRRLRRSHLHHARLRPRRACGVPRRRGAAGDRPAGAQEHGPRLPEDAAYIVRQFGIDVDRPLLLQVSRFDPWKDPLGVVDAYRAGQGAALRRAARADRLDGHATTLRAGTTSRSVIAYVGGDPDVTCSTTSTTSAASRSTPSSATPP